MASADVAVEVAYASAEKEVVIPLSVTPPCTVRQAIEQSGILNQFKEIDLTQNKVGIFSKKVALGVVLQSGDRVEIYRPLLINPKDRRRKLAAA